MNTELKSAVMATDRDAQYDNSAKHLIAHKIILARILVKTVEEFKGMDPLEVAALIEGLPYISAVPVEPGLTNAVHFQNGQRLVGFNTENQELNEGLVRFDIVFFVRLKDVLSQINAAKSALNGCGKAVLEGHVRHCVRDGIEHGDADKTIESFTKAVERFANMQ